MNNYKNIINCIIHQKINLRTIHTPKIDSVTKTEILSKPAQKKLDSTLLPKRTVIDLQTITLLERLSLVDCANKEGIKVLEDAIAFADQILQVNTEGIEPLITVAEDRPLEIREDIITEGNCRDDILSNASVTEEEYLVAPPGNIPLAPRENSALFDEKESSKINK